MHTKCTPQCQMFILTIFLLNQILKTICIWVLIRNHAHCLDQWNKLCGTKTIKEITLHKARQLHASGGVMNALFLQENADNKLLILRCWIEPECFIFLSFMFNRYYQTNIINSKRELLSTEKPWIIFLNKGTKWLN